MIIAPPYKLHTFGLEAIVIIREFSFDESPLIAFSLVFYERRLIFWYLIMKTKEKEKCFFCLKFPGVTFTLKIYSTYLTNIFKESALRADSFFKLKGPYVCLFVRHTFSLRLSVLLPPFPEVLNKDPIARYISNSLPLPMIIFF